MNHDVSITLNEHLQLYLFIIYKMKTCLTNFCYLIKYDYNKHFTLKKLGI